MASLREHKAVRQAGAALIVIVGLAMVVAWLGGPELFGRFQPLVLAVALMVWFVSIWLDERAKPAYDPTFTRIGLAGCAVLLVGSIVELAV